MEPGGLEAVYLANRTTLIRFLAAHGAGDAAEDLYQELWLRIGARETGPIAAPLAYLYRAANNLILDRNRAERQAAQRNRDWDESVAGAPTERVEQPTGERVLIARDQVVRAEAALQSVGPRAATILRRHRVDGVAQRDIAAELGVSLSTVESDLRRAYRAIIELRREFDEADHEA